MLRCHALKEALAAAILFVVAVTLPISASAQAPPQVQGATCLVNGSTAAATVGSGGQNLLCVSGIWQYLPYQFGSTALGCTSTQAGMIQWTGSAFKGCNGSSWGSLDVATSANLSSLLAATTTNSIDSANWAQTWKWGTLSTQTALTLTTPSMTTGTLLSLSNTATGANAGTVLSISNSEAGGFALQATGTSDFNGYVGIGTTAPSRTLDVASLVTHSTLGTASQFTVRGTANSTNKMNIGYDTTSNYGFIEAVNENTAWQNLALQPSGGNVGIGTTSPSTLLDVEGGASILILSANTSTNGTAIKGISTATSGGAGLFGIAVGTGTNYGVYGSETGASNTGFGVYAVNNSTTGWGVYSAGTSSNYFAGSVGIGTTSMVGLLTVAGDIDIAASDYLNFGSTDGSSGYGFRDNGGIMQAKGSGGTWGPIATVMAGNTQSSSLPAGNTTYCTPTGQSCSGTPPSATANAVITLMSHAGVVRNLTFLSGAASGSGKTDTATLYKNGSATAVTCSMTNAATCSDTTHSVSVAAGDYLTVQIVIPSGATATQHSWAFDLSY